MKLVKEINQKPSGIYEILQTIHEGLKEIYEFLNEVHEINKKSNKSFM